MIKKLNCKYLQVNKLGKKFKLIIKEEKIDFKLKKDEVIIKNFFSSINYRDFLSFKGNLAVARKFPYIPGVDFVGEIINSSSKKFPIGIKVGSFAIPNESAYPGVWSNYLKLRTKNLFIIKKGWNLEDVITVGTAGLAAASGVSSIIKNKSYKKDQSFSLLVTGATGGVGSISCILGCLLGWRIIAVTRELKKNSSFLKRVGVSEIIDTKSFLSSSSMNLLQQKYDAAIDCLGGDILSSVIKKLKNNGVCASAGLVADQGLSNLTVIPFLIRGVSLIGTGSEILDKKRKNESFRLISELIKSKLLKKLRKRIKFNEVNYFLNNWTSKKNKGRIIFKI